MLLDTSKFQLYSLGIVIEDKKPGEDLIRVTPIEHIPFMDGKIDELKEEWKNTIPDRNGDVGDFKVEQTHVMRATWIPFGHSNRITAPDVVKNETVMLFKYADTDEYYWTTIFREPKIRRREKVTYMYGNLKEPLKAWDKNSSYWIEISTFEKEKHIEFRTTKSDGEGFAYHFVAKPIDGFMLMEDDRGNMLKIDSINDTILIKANTKVIIDTPETIHTGVSYANPHVKCSGCLG